MSLVASLSERSTSIAVSETWLTAINDDIFNIPGYTFLSINRLNRAGGGVRIYLDITFDYKVRHDLSHIEPELESVFIEFMQSKVPNVLLHCVYKPPNTDLQIFNKLFSDILVIISGNKSKISFIAGDYNLDLLKSDSHTHTNMFLNNLLSHSFIPTKRYPTRITEYSATLIDNIFVNSMLYKFDITIAFNDISDHLPILMRFEIKFEKRKSIDVTSKPVFLTAAVEEFNLSFQQEDWSSIFTAANNNDEPTFAYSLFFAKYTALFEKHFRTQKLRLPRSDAPRQVWITRGLINGCKKIIIIQKNQYKITP